jgi:SH3 domain protein
MNPIRCSLFVLLAFGFMAQPSWAYQAFVTDTLRVTFRTGPSTGNKIIATLNSGEPMEVLDSQGDWTHVRLLDPDRGRKTGWIMTQYLVTRLPWEVQAKTLNEENARLKEEIGQIRRQLSEAVKREQSVTTQLRENTEALGKLKNEKFRSSQRTKWFGTGALVLLCGLMIGLVIGRQQKRKSSLY